RRAIARGNAAVTDHLNLSRVCSASGATRAGSHATAMQGSSETAASITKPPCQPARGMTRLANIAANAAWARACVTRKMPAMRSGTWVRTMMQVVTHSKTPSPKPAADRTAARRASPVTNVEATSSAATNNAAAMPTNLRRERDISASHTTMPRPSATISHMAITPTPESVALRASTMAPSKIGWTPITRRAMVPMVRADAMFARLSAGAWKFGRSTCIRLPASGLPRSQTRSHGRSVREAARYPNCDRDLHLFGPADVYFLFRKRRQRRNFPFQHPIGQWFRQDSSQPDQPAHDQRKHIVGTFAAQ